MLNLTNVPVFKKNIKTLRFYIHGITFLIITASNEQFKRDLRSRLTE